MLHSCEQGSQALVQLKHMELTPELLKISKPTQILLKICKNNSASLSDYSEGASRKFIFLLEETDEETALLCEGDEHLFAIPLVDPGIYHLQCMNYPKIKCKIELESNICPEKTENAQQVQQKAPGASSEMQNIAEVQEQKQDETKEEVPLENLQSSPSRSDYADYEKILNDQEMQYDYMPNKYLKYFKQEFKLWRDFFEHKPPKPEKEKYGSQGQEKLSTSSLSFSEKETDKEKSVISHLRSHQEIIDFHQEELSHPKTMKKTNSQYCFNIQREVEKTHVSSNSKRRPFNTNTSSPHQRTEQSQADTFLDWACSWASEAGFEELSIKKKGDRHLMDQWFTYLHNKFKITQFMFG